MILYDWTNIYIDSMNYFKKNILKKELISNKIICLYKDQSFGYFLVYENLSLDFFENLNEIKKHKLILVTLNKKENLNFVIEHWSKFLEIDSLKILFVNPKENLFWAVIPKVHNLVTGNLRLGLKSLFESVPEVL